MKIRIPCTVPDGHFAMPFYYDPATGKLDGVPVIALAKDSVTALTRHFSMLVVCSITTAYLDTVGVDTRFRPGKDDWQFENFGTHTVPRGRCAGMCLSVMWYWEKTGQNSAASRLWGQYDNDDREQGVPVIWEDDRLAHRLTSTLQKELDWDTLRAMVHSYVAEWAPKLSWYSAGHAMLLTGQPQYISVRNPGAGIGQAVFGRSHATWVLGGGGAPQALEDGHATAADRIEIGIQAAANQFTPKFKIYQHRTGKWLPAAPGVGAGLTTVVPLELGINRIGIYNYFIHLIDGAGRDRWSDFQWFDIYRLNLEVTAEPPVVQIDQSTTLSARYTGKGSAAPEFPRWEFQFGDGAKYAAGPKASASHSYAAVGEYEVIARLYHNVTNQLIGDGRVKVTVKPGPGEPTAPGGVAVRIGHNVGGKLATDRILSAGAGDPSKPRTMLSDLTGAKVDKTYSFTATATGLAAGTAVAYEWTFYDAGAPIIQQMPQISHRFLSAGTHSVRVRLLDRATRNELARGEVRVTLVP